MVKALFDTCILIDYLNGIAAARTELALYESRAISTITWMEVMVGASADNEAATRAWLATFDVLDIDPVVADRAVALRKARRMRLPDAIIWATAQAHAMLLVSRNTKEFPAKEPGIRVPYTI
ncbi:type II toxin-antitoxin system VapC family toxin [Cupriavidus sp. TMH.W2]|uniref:type II toxin-antitoxin system VapC family toxin n=1 Tax=Cupriavidus sp. TMH.W2 TaxID=3434465 RepID=UPI003D7756D0